VRRLEEKWEGKMEESMDKMTKMFANWMEKMAEVNGNGKTITVH
jgi:hypothetical protein